MTDNTTTFVGGEPSAGRTDSTRRSGSVSSQEATEPDESTSDEESDEDYNEETLRKSERPLKPTEKARQVKFPSMRKNKNASDVPPALDRGRFPRDRRVWTPLT